MAIQPTQARIRNVYIGGGSIDIDIARHTTKIEIFEDICKQFKTAKLTVIDNNNVLGCLNIVGGEPVTIAFDNLIGKVYEDTMHIISVSGECMADNKKAHIYTINLHGEEYFKDKANIVQHSFKKQTATAAVQILHKQFFGTGLTIKMPSLGPLAQETSHIISSLNPFTAIHQLKGLANYAQYKTGSTLYFRDVAGHVISPLEHLFDVLAPQADFVQKATWGSNWQDVFGAYNAIIQADTDLDANRAAAGRTTQDVAASAIQGNVIYDIKTKTHVLNQILGKAITAGKVAGSVDSIINNLKGFSVTGSVGARPNFQAWDTNQTPKANIPSLQTPDEALLQSVARNGPTVKLKVPIQTGLNCTVGKGITAQLLPPSGDLGGVVRNPVGGKMMVTELVHTIWTSDHGCQGTTTMKAIKGGYNR